MFDLNFYNNIINIINEYAYIKNLKFMTKSQIKRQCIKTNTKHDDDESLQYIVNYFKYFNIETKNLIMMRCSSIFGVC